MNKLYAFVERLYEKQVDSIGLAIFRVCYSLVLLGEIFFMFRFRNLIFDDIPFIQTSQLDFLIPLGLWMVAVIFLVLGLFTRIMVVVNYIFTLVFFATITTFEYHMYYAYTGINFLFLFLPISKSLSLDNLLLRLKFSTTQNIYKPVETTTVLSYFIPLGVGIGLVYFDSIFYKYTSPLWLKGLGVWLPGSTVNATWLIDQWILNQEIVIKSLGYITLAFESVFLFSFFLKKTRWWYFIIGIGLHIGILLEFPIPFFALGVCAIYILLVPIGNWRKWFKTKPAHKITFYYDAECPLCIRTIIVIGFFDWFKKVNFVSVQEHSQPQFNDIEYSKLLNNIYSIDHKGVMRQGLHTYIKVFSYIPVFYILRWLLVLPGIKKIAQYGYRYVALNRDTERCTEESCGIKPTLVMRAIDDVVVLKNVSVKKLRITGIIVGLGMCLLGQVNCVLISDSSQLLLGKFMNQDQLMRTLLPFKYVRYLTKTIAGITTHPVFMDSHFKDYNHIISIVYKSRDGDIWLPIINKNGTPGNYLQGCNWIKWTFRTNGPTVDNEKLTSGIERFTAFWAHEHNIDLNDARFVVKLKKINLVTDWEKDYLTTQIKTPWQDIAEVKWQNYKFEAHLPEIESL